MKREDVALEYLGALIGTKLKLIVRSDVSSCPTARLMEKIAQEMNRHLFGPEACCRWCDHPESEHDRSGRCFGRVRIQQGDSRCGCIQFTETP